MQLVHSKNKTKPKKQSEAQMFAKILADKWRVLDKVKAQNEVDLMVKKVNLPLL